MSNVKDFQVNYRLTVQASEAIAQLQRFTSSVNHLSQVEGKIKNAAAALRSMTRSMNKAFNGKDKTATIRIKTDKAEAGLNRVIKKLDAIEAKTKAITSLGVRGHAGGGGSGGGHQPPPIYGGGGGSNRTQAAYSHLRGSSMPSWRSLPFAGMVNAYLMYSAMTSELKDAIKFTHTVDAAKQVLRSTDTDIATFGDRFSSMMATVRKIGVDTKFTMVEMAQATQFMAQAGFSTDQITQSIEPISNLALIADVPIQEIADNLTGMLSGYRIDTNSSRALSDQLAATYTRSKASIQEIAESFKMSSGFLQMAGVEVSEAIAAFGVLGNANLRGTMAGTSVRSMMTFLAKPSKGAKQTMARLGVEITETVNVYGKSVNKIRSLADIFADLKTAGASLEDMSSIFGKIGGTGAMVLASRSDELRELTNRNKYSFGLAEELGTAKQNTTSGLWEQVTSQWSESFTQAFESLEPRIKIVLKGLSEKLATPEFTQGLMKLGEGMLGIFDVMTKLGVWVTSNWSWIQPVLIGGMVAKGIIKLTAALASFWVVARSAFAGKLALDLAAVGTSAAVATGGITTLAGSGGLSGAIVSIGALGKGFLIASGLIAAVGAAIAVVAIDWYQFEKRKDATIKEMESSKIYRFPSIEALSQSMRDATKAAIEAKGAKDALLGGMTVEEKYAHIEPDDSYLGKIKRVAKGFLSTFGANEARQEGSAYVEAKKLRDSGKHNEANKVLASAGINTGGNPFSRANAMLGKLAFIEASKTYKSGEDAANEYLAKSEGTPADYLAAKSIHKEKMKEQATVDASMYTFGAKGSPFIKDSFLKSPESKVSQTQEHHDLVMSYVNDDSVFRRYDAVAQGLGSSAAAIKMVNGEEIVKAFAKFNYKLDSNGQLSHKQATSKSTVEEVAGIQSDMVNARSMYGNIVSKLAADKRFGDSMAVGRLLEKTNYFPAELTTNDPGTDGSVASPTNYKNPTTGEGADISTAGGNYGGAGKMTSVAPKQVIVNIENLMSIETIKLMGTEEGRSPQIQELKESLTQLLIETVHDLDGSWNG